MKEYWASLTPEERRKRNANWQKAGVKATKSPKVRAKQSKLTKERWADPEYKAKHSAGIKKGWDESPPERKAKAIQTLTNEENIRKRGESIKQVWDSRSAEDKEEIANKLRQAWRNKSEEEIQAFSEMMSA